MKKIFALCLSCLMLFVFAACGQKQQTGTTPSPSPISLTSDPTPDGRVDEKSGELDTAELFDFLENDLYDLICEINYFNRSAYPMDGITDEQKIAFGLVANGAMENFYLTSGAGQIEETLISAEDVDKIVGKYFYEGIEEHKTLSGYIEAEYENGVYRVTYGTLIGANVHYLNAITVLPLTKEDLSGWRRAYWTDAPDSEDVIVCTADLMYDGAADTSIIGKSIITLIKKDGVYKIDRYRQEILSNMIMTETTYP